MKDVKDIAAMPSSEVRNHRRECGTTVNTTIIPGDVPDLKLENVTATVDTIEQFSVRPPPGLRMTIERALSRRIEIKHCRDKTGYLRGVRAIVNRPNLAVLPVLSNYRRHTNGCSTCRVDVAIDFTTDSEDAAKVLYNFLEQHVVLKWRPAGSRNWVESTTYWIEDWRRKSRNLCLYWKGLKTIRLELRFLNSRSVRRSRLDNPSKLRDLDPALLFQHHLRVVRPTERYVNEVKRRAVRDDRLRHLSKGIGKRPSTKKAKKSAQRKDRDRAKLPARVEHIYGTVGMQEFVSGRHPEHAIRKVSMDFLQIPTRLEWK